MTVQVNQDAPDFQAPDQNGDIKTLADYKGKWLLLYFYPKDFTSGCITEACSIRDNFSQLTKTLIVVGVSADSVHSHKKFEEKYNLPFTLLSDPHQNLIKKYETNGTIFPKRTSFLINPTGKIVKIYQGVNPEKHIAQVIADLQNT